MPSQVSSFASPQAVSWRGLYLQALFETDRKKAPSLIAEAERALVYRERELFENPQGTPEREAVNNALHALHALKNCIGSKSAALAA